MHSSTPHRFGLRPAGAPPEGRFVDLGRLLIGLTIVTLGVLFLLDSAGTLDAGAVVGDWWPALFVAAGLLTLAERPPAVIRGSLLAAGGLAGLLFTTGVIDENGWDYFWPAAIVVAGIAILFRWQGGDVAAGARDEDVVRATAIFGGPNIASTSPRFRGAWLTAVFGGVTLDLRDARPAPEGATVNVTAAFGGVDLIVPRGWRINVRSTPIFGGVDDKTDRSVPPTDDAPVLNVDAVCVFGGMDIKHKT